MKNRAYVIAIILMALSLQVRASSRVVVCTAEQSAPVTVINDATDLIQLLTRPLLTERSWKAGMIIAEPSATAAARQQQQLVIRRLNRWSQLLRIDGNDEQAEVVNSVARQMSRLHITGRQFVSLDPDLIRLRPGYNYRLSGEYVLWLNQKPTTVTLFGVIKQSGKTLWQPGRDTVDYLRAHPRQKGAERNVVQVIDVDGGVTEVPIAYWNHRYYAVPLGSLIFVGFSNGSLPHDYRDLNQQIISVLTHRIPD
ncbi:capsule biosynthesis GfcC D2 domain-containing protein [Enterobacteriaceae bacterium LUAb1]